MNCGMNLTLVGNYRDAGACYERAIQMNNDFSNHEVGATCTSSLCEQYNTELNKYQASVFHHKYYQSVIAMLNHFEGHFLVVISHTKPYEKLINNCHLISYFLLDILFQSVLHMLCQVSSVHDNI